MPGFGFGKRPTPRRFEYLPRYYDEAKEELENRIGAYDEKEGEEMLSKHRIRMGLRNKYYGNPELRSSETRKSNVRLIYIILILSFVTYLIIKSDRFIRIIESLGG